MHQTSEQEVCTSRPAQHNPHTDLTDIPNVSECHQTARIHWVAGSLFRAQRNESPWAFSATKTQWQTWTCSCSQPHRESHQSRPPAPTPMKNTFQKLAKPTPSLEWPRNPGHHRAFEAKKCVSTFMRVSPTHAESPKEMTVNHRKKKSRWLHNSRSRYCRCWMRSKPNCLVVCEQKMHFPSWPRESHDLLLLLNT